MDTIVTPVTVITLDSTKIVHNIKADLTARLFPPVVRLVQYDQSLPVIAVSLMQNGQAYTLPSGAAANIRVHKPDATYVYNPALGCDSTRKIVYFEVTQAMAAAQGDGLAIVEIVVDGDIAGTSLITLHFEENPVPEEAIESSDEWETIYELGERIIASTVTPVSTAAGMTDHNVVYLYTGTESGWNQGHMYYYNGTTWVDAGIAVTDTTLSVAGLAADAKKTGDEIADLKDGLLDMYVTDTASGAIASFPDGADNIPVKSLAVDIEPVQSGSGDPSPTNIRPISGHTSAVVTVSPTTDAQDGTSYTIDLGGTRYGGTLDVTTGVLTVETEIKTLNGSEGFWSGTAVASGTRRFYTDTSYANKAIVACDSAKISTDTTVLNIICVSGNRLIMTPSWAQSATTIADFKTLLASNNVTIIQTLATPFTVQLTAQDNIATVLGQNNVWNDCGDTTVEYRADTKLYINKVLNA